MSHDNMTVTDQCYGELTMKAGCSRPPKMVPPFFFTTSENEATNCAIC